ncbi:MAG: 23S rRNA (guanosine(2251)-2'-O)-methyltransferase RlmB [Chloracidobacterium sp.]|nr:23S rRNA (guanosine(2251)-2'-O)-methyltransferase RlmB [Chloracidobacterium sp.]
MKRKSEVSRHQSRAGRSSSHGGRPKRRAHPISQTQDSRLIYGVLPVLEALRADKRRIDKVLIAEGVREKRLVDIIDLCHERCIAWNRVPRDTFTHQLGSDANHQGVMAFIASAEYANLDQVLDKAAGPALLLLLDGVEDPRNLGAIIRTAECAGADGIIIPERRAVGLTDTVAKSSAGAVEFLAVAKAQNLNSVIKTLKDKNVWVVGTSADASTSYTDWDWTRPSALVLGGEGRGIHRLVADNCDVLVNIPMYGKIDSLNVSVAAGVILFEARRQRT